MLPLTLEDVKCLIEKLSDPQQKQPAKVYPPGECPATSAVNVTELRILTDGSVMILTGKNP